MERLHAIVHGDVQGVCFRMYTCEQAARLGVSGWVRNRADGTVELVAEGSAHALAELAEWCRHGPPSATVTDLRLDRTEATGEYSTFRIVR